jgi:hypothetical protein
MDSLITVRFHWYVLEVFFSNGRTGIERMMEHYMHIWLKDQRKAGCL